MTNKLLEPKHIEMEVSRLYRNMTGKADDLYSKVLICDDELKIIVGKSNASVDINSLLMSLDDFAERVLIPLIYDNVKETKMTREEAIKKLLDTGRWSTEKADLQVSSLEALELIKFDDQVAEFTPTYLIGDERVQKLIANGYQIVKLWKYSVVRIDNGNYSKSHAGKLLSIEQGQS